MMLKLSLNTLQKSFKVLIQRIACSSPPTSSPTLIPLTQGCKLRNSKSVIWKRYRAKEAVLLDNLCNNNLIIFEQSKQWVVGFHDKINEHYNNAAKCVDKRLEEFDVIGIFKLALGKYYANIKDVFIILDNYLWPTVCDLFVIKPGVGSVFITQFCLLEQPKVQADGIHADNVPGLDPAQNQCPPYNANNPFLAPVTVNRELHKGGDRSCLHIELNIKGSNMHYNAGDHLAMYPINDKKLVERLGKLCEADLGTVFSFTNTGSDSKKHPLPCPTTYRFALTHYLEVTAKPTTHFLKELAEYCADKADKKFLLSVTSNTSEGKQKYQTWIEDSCRNIVHILEDIKSCKPPIEEICKLLPRLQPRYYSISSSSKLYPTDVHITAVMVKYKTPTGRINKGVATAFLKAKQAFPGEVKVPIFICKSKFHLPANSETPIIMVGPGTGLAPFRAFIQERQFLRDEGKIVGDTVLYFGCRRKNEDFIYKEELEEYVAKGTLTLKTAFSRDQEQKIYVTHLIEQDADLLWKILGENNGHFYICGDAKNIAVDVKRILVKIISNKGNMSENDAMQYIKEMEAQKRYLTDVWS